MSEFYDNDLLERGGDCEIQEDVSQFPSHITINKTKATTNNGPCMRQIEIMQENKLLMSSLKNVYD